MKVSRPQTIYAIFFLIIVLKRKNFLLLYNVSFSWSNNQIDVRQYDRRKTNLILNIHTWEVGQEKGSMNYICHPELRTGLVTWGFAGEEGKSQDEKKIRCSVIRCLLCHTARL